MYDPQITYQINKCVFDVYNTLGNIWNEETYENALEIALNESGFHCQRQVEYDVYYYQYRVGKYRMDMVINDDIVIELKAVPETLPLHKAQLISYLKGTQKPIGLLANFGQEEKAYYQYFPNKLPAKCLQIHFDKSKTSITDKLVLNLLESSKTVLEYLGPGYFHHVYQRAMNHEIRMLGLNYQKVKSIEAIYHGQIVGSREVRFFKIDDLLYAPIAVESLDDNILHKFTFYIRHTASRRGLIVNFKNLNLNFRYFDVYENR